MDSLEEILSVGELEIEGRLSGASNATLRCRSSLSGESVLCVYKPMRGERPLWDFPSGTLGLREVGAHDLDRALGWDLVPTTVWRDDGPYGAGLCQLWVEAGPDDPVDVVPLDRVPAGWRVVAEGEGPDGGPVCLAHEDSADLQRLCLLDAVMNNADRKGGHVLRRPDGRPCGIDHGLAFHDEDKLRTVLWGWAGRGIAADDIDDLRALVERWESDPAIARLALLISPFECDATRDRAAALVAAGRFPDPGGAWPALPWPAM